MRRMYSEQELSVIVYQVMGQYIEAGAFDQTIADYIDAYLVEHPIDPTAITGLDIAPKDVTASGNITAPSIIEDMSGYSISNVATDITLVYASAVKNGNKLTLVAFGSLNSAEKPATGFWRICNFNIPIAVGNKLTPYSQSGLNNILDKKIISLTTGVGVTNGVDASCIIQKSSATALPFILYDNANIQVSTNYVFRVEATFLLSENFVSQE